MSPTKLSLKIVTVAEKQEFEKQITQLGPEDRRDAEMFFNLGIHQKLKFPKENESKDEAKQIRESNLDILMKIFGRSIVNENFRPFENE